MLKLSNYLIPILIIFSVTFYSCNNDDDDDNVVETGVNNPETADKVEVDRFSDDAGVLMKRSENPELPGPNEPVDFDQEPFITQSFGPSGEVVKYYNFDVQPIIPAPIYVLFKEGSDEPVKDQLNIIDVIPGDIYYNDFWQVFKVTVPADYTANTVSSRDEIYGNGYEVSATASVVNCPVAPEGSTATLRYLDGNANLISGWYKNKIVYYFTFEEHPLEVNESGTMPVSPVYVTFNVNPDESDPNSGPASGFVVESGTSQTHNVVATIPGDEYYSPLWSVNVYDIADFNNVSDLTSAENANILAEEVMNVNCPIVYVE